MTDRGEFAEILDAYLVALKAGHAPEREALLARHPELAEELRAALVGIDFLHGAAPRLSPDEHAGEHADALPEGLLGDYRLLRELGRGGMAVVYEAEQVSLARHVALKVLPFAAVLDPKQLQRFKNEALAAAHLRHPNIVPVYGVGCERGVHYYAMQYVEGQSLATAIGDMKGRGGGPREGPKTPISSHGSHREPAYIRMAAALGVQAAQALDHAHQLGIVHRDVKPGNLLADLAGTLWVTDFGLASSMKDASLTITGELLGTIRYMSPEQTLAKRVPVDHRTDVYSLGATLYELLTLEPAFPGDDAHRVIQDIASKEPVLPRRLNPALPRDLETVVLKAMSKDPPSRYATAQEMADDLTRFLENLPIEAKRPGLIWRAAQWSRRHRTLVAASVVLLLLSIAGLATGTALLWREQAQTKKAFENAQANLSLALEALDQVYIDEAEGHPKIREGLPRDLLEKGLGFYEQFVKENARNQGLVFLMGNACHRAALMFRELGEETRAVEYLDRALSAFDRAVEIDPRMAGPHNNRGVVLCDHLGRLGEALVEFDRAIELDPRVASSHANRGRVLRMLGRFEEALAACDRSLEIDARCALAHVIRSAALRDLGRGEESLAAYDRAVEIDPQNLEANNTRGAVLSGLGRFEEALAAFDRALEIDPRSAFAHNNRGHALHKLGRFAESLAACDRALEIEPLNVFAHDNRGIALGGLGRVEEALAAHDRAIEIGPRLGMVHSHRGLQLGHLGRFEEALAAHDQAIEIEPRNAKAHNNRGTTLDDFGRLERALAAYDQALEIEPQYAAAHRNRGNTLSDLGRLEDAVAAYDRSLEIEPRNALAHANRASALNSLERFEEALAACDRALEIDPRYLVAHINRGIALGGKGDLEAAIGAYREAIRLRPDFPEALCNLGLTLTYSGRFREAVPYLRKGHELGSKSAAWALPSAKWIEDAERKAELEDRLDRWLSGKARPGDALERIEFALALYGKARHAESARMYADAFAEDAALADDLAQGHRYNAACSAALAAAPGGADAAESRGLALAWLRAELAAREQAPSGLAATLEHWKKDPDFASVRDRLIDLPEPERAAWRRLWTAVDLALVAARPASK